MRFQKEVNIFAPDAILKRFQANETNFSVVKGKIEALISESEILELQNSKVTMYSKLADVKLTVDGLEQTYTDIAIQSAPVMELSIFTGQTCGTDILRKIYSIY